MLFTISAAIRRLSLSGFLGALAALDTRGAAAAARYRAYESSGERTARLAAGVGGKGKEEHTATATAAAAAAETRTDRFDSGD